MPYVDPATLKGELPFDHRDFPVQSEEQFNGALDRALSEASAFVDSISDTAFEPTEAELTFSRPGYIPTHDLPLPKRPIVSVDSVAVEGELVDGSNYGVHETHLEHLTGRWPTERRLITVAWTYGYAEVPAPVEGAVIRLARNALDQIETDGYTSDGDGWQYRPPATLKAECAAMIDDYAAPSYFGGAMIV